MTYPSSHDDSHLYFITASVVGWKPILLDPHYSKIILDSLTWLRLQGRIKLFAFVLMPSHLHWIAKPINTTISELVQQFGSFTAHEILKQLKKDNQGELLRYLETQKRDHHRLHSVWQDIQAKNIFTNEVLNQELEYIHSNPISKKWQLTNNRADYQYSSACYYDRNEKPVIAIDDVRDWLE